MDIIQASIKGDLDRVKELLDQGVDPNIKNDNGDAALIFGSYYGYTDIVRLLLEHGANPDIKDKYRCTAYIYARNECIRDMLRYANRCYSTINNRDRSREYMSDMYHDLTIV